MSSNIIPIQADFLKGANCYFTNFDHRIISELKNNQTETVNIERNLKILLLTKKNIVCAASHLVTPYVYNFLKDNPVLLREGLIIPALRKDKESIEDLFEREDLACYYDKNAIDFYNDNVYEVIEWDLNDNSSWFKEVFMHGISNENSVLRNSLPKKSNINFDEIIAELNNIKILDRNTIENLFINYDLETQKVIKNFRELIYHISGARIVNCESNLPQENYIDYSITDIENRKIQLSDSNIFRKFFLEIVLEKVNGIKLPDSFLDMLTFDDIHSLREPLIKSDFFNYYEQVTEMAFQEFDERNDNNLLYSHEEITEIAIKMESIFSNYIETELKSYHKKKSNNAIKKVMTNIINIGIGLLPMTLIQNLALNIIGEQKSIRTNIYEAYDSIKSINNKEHPKILKQKKLLDYCSKYQLGNSTLLIESVKLITNFTSKKIGFDN